ncbi:hypothetical protein BDW22DRAFT_1433648 [Trametopsis cervina]|nr:hypothetical protein BDW22DRAFT_1433648 [Trametopsis cervina]
MSSPAPTGRASAASEARRPSESGNSHHTNKTRRSARLRQSRSSKSTKHENDIQPTVKDTDNDKQTDMDNGAANPNDPADEPDGGYGRLAGDESKETKEIKDDKARSNSEEDELDESDAENGHADVTTHKNNEPDESDEDDGDNKGPTDNDDESDESQTSEKAESIAVDDVHGENTGSVGIENEDSTDDEDYNPPSSKGSTPCTTDDDDASDETYEPPSSKGSGRHSSDSPFDYGNTSDNDSDNDNEDSENDSENENKNDDNRTGNVENTDDIDDAKDDKSDEGGTDGGDVPHPDNSRSTRQPKPSRDAVNTTRKSSTKVQSVDTTPEEAAKEMSGNTPSKSSNDKSVGVDRMQWIPELRDVVEARYEAYRTAAVRSKSTIVDESVDALKARAAKLNIGLPADLKTRVITWFGNRGRMGRTAPDESKTHSHRGTAVSEVVGSTKGTTSVSAGKHIDNSKTTAGDTIIQGHATSAPAEDVDIDDGPASPDAVKPTKDYKQHISGITDRIMKFVDDMQKAYGLTVSTEVRLHGEDNESCVLRFNHTTGLSLVTESAISVKGSINDSILATNENTSSTSRKAIGATEPVRGATSRQPPTEHTEAAGSSVKRKRRVTPQRTSTPEPSVKRMKSDTSKDPAETKQKKRVKTGKGKEVIRK